jgi:hypothetical protein
MTDNIGAIGGKELEINIIEWQNLSRSLQIASKIGLFRKQIESLNDLTCWMEKRIGDGFYCQKGMNSGLNDLSEPDTAYHYSSCFA